MAINILLQMRKKQSKTSGDVTILILKFVYRFILYHPYWLGNMDPDTDGY